MVWDPPPIPTFTDVKKKIDARMRETEERAERMGMSTEHVAGDVWRVGSESSSSSYIVDLAVPKCTCTDWATKRNKRIHQGLSDFYECKHVIAAKEVAQVEVKAEKKKEQIDAAAEDIMARFRKK